MTPEARSRALRQEADQVLELIRLQELLAPLGRLIPTGSYFLDLMMYPDIDFNLPLTTPEKLLSVGAQLSKLECVKKIRYLRGGPGDLKNGFYLKPEISYGNWGRLWKIDIWSLPSAILEKTHTEMADLRTRMTPEDRAIILDTKYRLLTEDGRTPMFSGIFIYRAVVNLAMTKHEVVAEYLVENGIVL